MLLLEISSAYKALTLATVAADGCPGSSPACSISDDNLASASSRLRCCVRNLSDATLISPAWLMRELHYT